MSYKDPTRALHVLQLTSKSAGGVRGKLVAREIDILQRELHTKAVVYIMGRAHVHMRSHPKSVLDWSVYIPRLLMASLPHQAHRSSSTTVTTVRG